MKKEYEIEQCMCDYCDKKADFPNCNDAVEYGDGDLKETVINCEKYKYEEEQHEEIYYSSLLYADKIHKATANEFANAKCHMWNVGFSSLHCTGDIWVRDFMPVKTKTGKYISFKYEPSYHITKEEKERRTIYKDDIRNLGCFPFLDEDIVTYSDINLDGGNVVFSPSKNKAIISSRIFSENPDCDRESLIKELERHLETQIIIIPSLPKKYDMTGHADGMVRFVDENTALINKTGEEFENKLKKLLEANEIDTIYFPYFNPNDPKGISAIGCYLNYLETKKYIALPVFGIEMDEEAIKAAESIFKNKTIIPVNINEIAKKGGGLNCITWEK